MILYCDQLLKLVLLAIVAIVIAFMLERALNDEASDLIAVPAVSR